MNTCSAFYYTIVVAVVGPSRVGKTSLVNAYLKRSKRKTVVTSDLQAPPDNESTTTTTEPPTDTPESEHDATECIDIIPSAIQMEDLVHNRMIVYDTPGEEGRRSLGMGVIDGSVSSSHAAVVMYDVSDAPPYPSLLAAEWWLQSISVLTQDVKVVLVGAHADQPRTVPLEMAEALASRYEADHLSLSDVSTVVQAHGIFSSVCERVYLKLRMENSPLIEESDCPATTVLEPEASESDAGRRGQTSPRSRARTKWQKLAASSEHIEDEDDEEEYSRTELRFLPDPIYNHPPIKKQTALEAQGDTPDFIFTIYVTSGEGSRGVGCSSLLDAFASQMQMHESIGTQFATSLVTTMKRQQNGHNTLELVRLKLYYQRSVDLTKLEAGGHTYLLLCWCDRASFDAAKSMLATLPPGVLECLVLVHCKADLDCDVTQTEIDEVRDTLAIPCQECSSVLGSGVNELFLSVTTAIRAKAQAYQSKVKRAVHASAQRLHKQVAQRRWNHLPMASLSPLDCNHSTLLAMFKEVDVNKNGFIERSELEGLRAATDSYALNDFDRALDSVQCQNGSTPQERLSFEDFAGLLLRMASL